MKTVNTIEEAVVGRTIKLSIVECLVVADLVSSLTTDINPKSKYTNVRTEELINMRNMLMKITGQDIISIDAAKEELFAPVEEELRYDVEGNVITSTVEAYSGHRNDSGEHKVGHTPLKKGFDSDDINNLVDA